MDLMLEGMPRNIRVFQKINSCCFQLMQSP